MPLYKTITIDTNTSVFIWKIEEPAATLAKGLQLTDYCSERISCLKSESQQKQFLSIRHLLSVAGYTDKDMYYNEKGKPYLKDLRHISISHSHEFSCLMISDRPVGIDIEKKRDKILRIAHKFTPLEEYHTLANTDAKIRKLTIVWGAKEAIYKALNIPGLSFLNDIYIEDFDFETGKTVGEVIFNGRKYQFNLIFTEFEGFTCVYALSSLTA